MLTIVAVCLSAASLLLHAFAPRTKNKVDDRVTDIVDMATKILPTAQAVVDAAKSNDAVGKPGDVRDHRGQ